MSQVEAYDEEAAEAAPRPRRRWRRWAAGAGVLALLGVGYVWYAREDIANDLIARQLDDMGLPATYKVKSVGTGKQVLTDLVIGDPRQPDLTIERVEVALTTRWGFPGIGRITLIKPRIYGRYVDDQLTFGSLDPVIFTGSKEPFRLPDLDIAIVDGRGLMESGLGPVGFKLDGKGQLRDGFKGVIAATAPKLALADCRAENTTFYADLTVTSEQPAIKGPLRLGSLSCPEQSLQLSQAALQLDAKLDALLDGGEGNLKLTSGPLGLGALRLAATKGDGAVTFRKGALVARYDLSASGLAAGGVSAASLASSGTVRGHDNFARLDVDGDLTGSGIQPGRQADQALAAFERQAAGTLAEPLIARIRPALQREGRGSSLSGQFVMRQSAADGLSLVVPQARLTGASGQALLALSRVQLTARGEGTPVLAGNFSTGGANLPRITGRMERSAAGHLMMRMAMADYAAGTARLAVPQLMLTQASGGALGFAGSARLSGVLPGGMAQNLVLPLDGNWSSRGGLAMWRSCTEIAFDRLAYANLTLDNRRLTLCPSQGGAIVRTGSGGLRIAAGAPALRLDGRLGTTPIRISSGPVGFAVPGSLAARSLDITLGSATAPSRFRVSNLTARIGSSVAGKFSGSDVLLAAVPLDMHEASGEWRYANGRLSIVNGAFRLEDRLVDDRFQPMIAHGGVLTLENNRITADAVMREPKSDREVGKVALLHNLGDGVGHADLTVDGINFDDGLQPDTLTNLALGVIANARGTVRGTGRIDWTANDVTSSGEFSTDRLDFAAAFGPAEGVSGKVVFTDLLGLVTAPDQKLKIASINPGIEANDGSLSFELRPEGVLAINGAFWPFLDGKLTLEPTQMVLGASETRRFTLRIEGLDAAKFIARMEMANIAASGAFDGVLPLVFDEDGGRIDGGVLTSLPPGGNVSYIGQLTYQDLSPFANFAFDSLKSINYKQMRIDLSGALEGEIITRVSFDGLSQGKGARSNLVTRQIAKLPLRFNVNLRAPFFSLVSNLRSLYDSSYVQDPRTLGKLDSQGRPILAVPPPVKPPVSETRP